MAIRQECSSGLKAGKNRLQLLIIPLTGKSLDDWPEGFADAVRKFGGLQPTASIFPNWYHLLPFYSGRWTGRTTGRIKPSPVIVGTVKCDRLLFHRIKVRVEDLLFEFGVVLRTFSKGEGGDLLPGEKGYIDFTSSAGSMLNYHGVVPNIDSSEAWLAFLVEYVWKHKRPKVSQGVATVQGLWKVSLEAIDRLLTWQAHADVTPQVRKTRRGPKKKPLSENEERLLAMYEKGWKTQFRSFYDLAEAAGGKFTAETAKRLIGRIEQQRRRERKRRDKGV